MRTHTITLYGRVVSPRPPDIVRAPYAHWQWSVASEWPDQATWRLHRLGQADSVLISVVGLAGTFDERIAEIAQSKAQAQSEFTRENAA
jgi:hypothetical protein